MSAEGDCGYCHWVLIAVAGLIAGPGSRWREV